MQWLRIGPCRSPRGTESGARQCDGNLVSLLSLPSPVLAVVTCAVDLIVWRQFNDEVPNFIKNDATCCPSTSSMLLCSAATKGNVLHNTTSTATRVCKRRGLIEHMARIRPGGRSPGTKLDNLKTRGRGPTLLMKQTLSTHYSENGLRS
eukprot:3938657-Rhodomonas_salina.1